VEWTVAEPACIDQRVYRALNARCGLFEQFVGPMQPVLSRALRMLIGRENFDEDALERVAQDTRDDPTLMQAFPEDDPVEVAVEPILVAPTDIEALLDALAGTGNSMTAATNSRYRVENSTLQLVTAAAAVADHPDASVLDGLDPRQWALLRRLQRPGERLPLCFAEAEDGGFRVMVCAWITSDGVTKVRSFADLKSLVRAWDGREPAPGDWNHARIDLEGRAAETLQDLRQRAAKVELEMRQQQLDAARLRLIEELGRMLICFEPKTDDLNGKLYRLASEATPTAMRLRRVIERLGTYPDWTIRHIAALREFRATLNGFQLQTRLTGKTLEAALDDPRWAFVAAN
jgi:hypothetical protein